MLNEAELQVKSVHVQTPDCDPLTQTLNSLAEQGLHKVIICVFLTMTLATYETQIRLKLTNRDRQDLLPHL